MNPSDFSSTEARRSADTIFWNVGAGAGMGAMVGCLAGLAISPVVSSLLGTVSAAAIAIITLKKEQPSAAALARVAGFGAS